TSFSPADLVKDTFVGIPLPNFADGSTSSDIGETTLREAVCNFKNIKRPKDEIDGGARILLRAAVAAILNADHPDVAYPRSTQDIIDSVNTALMSSDRDDLIMLGGALDIDNNLGCPF
ncbi:MAG: hypothetical protein ACR2NW_07375, partial [Thermodesulfobacteriota bacterium]